jgi:hypothetical protein
MHQAPHQQVEVYRQLSQKVAGMFGAQAARLAFEALQFCQVRMHRACAGYDCAAVHLPVPFAWLTAQL